jgi:ADP-ribose pyrophosphatase YjhB (NUDIX family)
MTTFVLVPGGFVEGWHWSKVACRLRKAEHRVEAIEQSPSAGHDPATLGDLAPHRIALAVTSVEMMSRSRRPEARPVEQYVADLARKAMAAGVLFRDRADRILLVEPSYKPNWEIPGGVVEADESPWAAATRELAEELGWDVPLGRLLVVDHVRPQDSRPEGLRFVFDGGVLDDADLVGTMFPDAEILSAGFHTLAHARSKVKPLLADRIAAALVAVEQGVTVLCEQGRRVA